MNRTTAIMILLFAAALEAGGDAIIRMGLHTNTDLASLRHVCGSRDHSFRVWLDCQRASLGFRKAPGPIRRLLLPYRPTHLLALFQATTFSPGSLRWIVDRCRRNRNLVCKGIELNPGMWPKPMSGQLLLKNIDSSRG